MASTVIVLLQLLLVSLASASHHFGGSSSFTYKKKNTDGTLMYEFRTRSTFDHGCRSYNWRCSSGDCGTRVQRWFGQIDSSTNAPASNRNWCESEAVEKRKIRKDQRFELRERSCCWIRKRAGSSFWQLSTVVDLGTRSDTGIPNRSPDIAIMPFLRIPQNCPRSYSLMSYDPDGDAVRCRYGIASKGECAGCHRPAGFWLDQYTCTLYYKNTTADPRVFGFELAVEDFPRKHISLSYSHGAKVYRQPYFLTFNSTSGKRTARAVSYVKSDPLSKLSLQFSFLVDPQVPSCQVGLYLPKLLHPTPQDGARIQAEVNKVVEIRVKAKVTYGWLEDIIISGPLNITKARTTHNEFVIRWTPIAHNLWNHYPVCFVVESATTNSSSSQTKSKFTTAHNHQHHTANPAAQTGVYQSEMRCVLIDVREGIIKTNVVCTESTMRVEVEKLSFAGLHDDHLQLNDHNNVACNLQTHSNSTHVIGIVPLNGCGTEIEEDDHYLFFRNTISAYDDKNAVITRKHLLEVHFYCQYNKKGNVTLSYTAHRKQITVWDRGLGTFTYQFEFYPDEYYGQMINPTLYPLVYKLGTRIFMQIQATSTVINTVLFVESCTAAPFDNPKYSPSYTLIENGCNLDPTIVIHPRPNNQTFRFSISAFKFIGMFPQVYITCSVIMCEAGNPNSRCAQGCIPNGWPPKNHAHNHKRRAAAIQTESHFVSQGPLQLAPAEESRTRSVTVSPNLSLNMVFIAGCLLAAVAMVSGVTVYRTRRSGFRYQPLATK